MERTRYFCLVLALIGAMVNIGAQNLLQNPGFESVSSWDEFWVLSTSLPSSISAVAIENTQDAHEGLKSVELSNTVGNQWTYFYSDVQNAPLTFKAGERYVIRGWIKSLEEGKGVSLSVFWNNSMDQKILYDQNPDPLTHPDWFMVVDTIEPGADFEDGYLSLGFRAGKIGPLVAGKLLVDDFAVERLPSRETEVISCAVAEQTKPAIIDHVLHTVSVEVPFGTDVTALVPTIRLSPGATIAPGSGVAVDFTSPRTYQVIAEDGITSQDWTFSIQVLPASTRTDILSFLIDNQTAPATIDNVFHTVIVEVEYGTDLHSMVPAIGLSPGATIVPGSDIATNFSAPLVYTVTAEDGVTTQDYIVVVMTSPVSNKTDIIKFKLADEVGPASINPLSHTISLQVPAGTDLTALVPDIGLSAGATIDPGIGAPADFSAPVVYRVTAEDGTTIQDWTVRVLVLPSNQTKIESFSIAEQTAPATIDTLWHTVSLMVSYGTDVTALVPFIELSAGAAILPGEGIPGDFTRPLTYTVIAEDGITRQDWTVTIMVQANNQADIESFMVWDAVSWANINGTLKTVMLEVPFGTDVTKLVPDIGLSAGASISPGNNVVRDFSTPLTYTVIAEDGITRQDWTVTVVVLPNDQTEILSFSVNEETNPASIDRLMKSVTLNVKSGTDLSRLIPDIELSAGASSDPMSGVVTDFTYPVEYRVLAQDGISLNSWMVVVHREEAVNAIQRDAHVGIKVYPNPAKEFIHIEFSGNADIHLIDMTGRAVKNAKDATDQITLPVWDLERGAYLLQVRREDSIRVVRLLLD